MSKAVNENLKAFQHRFLPVFLNLNRIYKNRISHIQSNCLGKWRSTVLHSNKMKEYLNI